MKLAKLQSEKNTKLVVTVPEAVASDLAQYQHYYFEVYGVEISESRLVSAMLEKFMKDDAAFSKRNANLAAKPSAPQKSKKINQSAGKEGVLDGDGDGDGSGQNF